MNLRPASGEQAVVDGSIFITPAKAEDFLPPAERGVWHWRDHLAAARCLLARIINGDLHVPRG